MSVSLCLITGQVLRPDGTAYANGSVIFNSVIPQVVQSTVIPATQIVATTDASGNINGGSGVNLVQGLQMTVSLTLNGNANGQYSVLVPNTGSASFASITIGLQLSGSLAVVTGTFVPTLTIQGGVQPAVTYTTQIGNYCIIAGTLVTIAFSMVWTAQSGGSGGGPVGCAGLPFNFQNVIDMYCGSCQINGITFTAGYTYMFLRGIQNSNIIAMVESGSNNAGSFIGYSQVATGVGALIGSCTYRTI